jgi:ribosomal protein L16 Arg81 hydroxylase
MQGMVFDQLAKLLEPCLPEDFLNSSWGRTHTHIRGWAGKFSPLLPWESLNEILRRHRLEPPRLRLTQDGKAVASSNYLRHVQSGRNKNSIPRLLPVELTAELRRGATLVLDAVDELHQPLEELAEGLERAFHEHVQINAYAGWRTSRGFDLHWDDHDVFILQVTGRKRWSIYGMTRRYPLVRDVETAQKPAGAPLWEGTLEDGDLLYIPRGWWHVALPLDEPTLHLTVGIHNRTGLDLLRWTSERLRAREDFRRDLPRFATRAEASAHIAKLREQLLEEWGEDVLDRFYREADANAEARPRLSLPWSGTPEILPSKGDALVRLNAPRGLDLKTDAQQDDKDVIEFSCQGKRWRFAAESISILRPLVERGVCSVNELCEAAKGKLDERTVRAFLGELILHGLLAVVVVKNKSQR